MKKLCVAAAAMFAGILPASSAFAATVYTTGYNQFGQLGDGTTNLFKSTFQTIGLSGVTSVSGGQWHSLAAVNGAAVAWGRNESSELGNASSVDSTVPVNVVNLTTGVTAVFAGGQFSLAIQNGGVYSWGDGTDGQLGDGNVVSRSDPGAVQTLASGVTAITGGYRFGLALQSGAVKAWGFNANGQLGNGGTTNASIPVQVNGLTTGVTAASAWGKNSIAIQNGAAKTWGNNSHGEYGNGTTTSSLTPVAVSGLTSGVTSVSMGESHVLAIKGGDVYSWGGNKDGELGNGSSSDTALQLTPVLVTGAGNLPHNFIKVAAGGAYSYDPYFDPSGQSFALTADNRLFAWGYNLDGELGLGVSGPDVLTPTELFAPSGQKWSDIEAGDYHTVAILSSVPEPSGIFLLTVTALGMLATSRRCGKRGSAVGGVTVTV